MTAMIFGIFAFILTLGLQSSGASPTFPELNPALGKFQDISPCLPVKETWYTVYRNYENDPAFGGTAKCGRFSSQGPAVDGSYPMLFQYGEESVDTLVTLSSSEGYKESNLLYFQHVGDSNSVMVRAAYEMCECVVFRNTYISEEACTLIVPESNLEKENACCHFAFDLLCGTAPKYYTYDETCRN